MLDSLPRRSWEVNKKYLSFAGPISTPWSDPSWAKHLFLVCVSVVEMSVLSNIHLKFPPILIVTKAQLHIEGFKTEISSALLTLFPNLLSKELVFRFIVLVKWCSKEIFGFSLHVVLFFFSSLFCCCCNVHYYLGRYFCYSLNVLCLFMFQKFIKIQKMMGRCHSGFIEVKLEHLS